MKRWWLVAALVGSIGTAQAQAPEAVASFLEHRVPEELALEGVLLSRHNVTLHIEQVGDVLILSLVDNSTTRVVASTKLDAVPADREAAVATTTHLVADLVTQISAAAPVPAPLPEPAPAPAPPPVVAPDPQAHEIAELRFKRESIRFGDDYDITVTNHGGSIQRKWVALQGDLDERLEPDDFYQKVGRPDLATAYDHRRDIMIGAYVVTGLGAGLAAYALMSGSDDGNDDWNEHVFIGAGLVAVVAGTVGTVYRFHLQPISESEAKQLAEQHNQALRRRLGLPVVDVRVAPVATGTNGGLALSGKF
jgi:hypothetical protein